MSEKDIRNEFRRILADYYDQTVLLCCRENGSNYAERREDSLRELASDIESYIRFKCEADTMKREEEVEIV